MQTEQTPDNYKRPSFNREQAFQNFFESAPMMMGVAELEDGDIRHVIDNEASAKFFRTPKEVMSGKLASQLLVPVEAIQYWTKKYQESERSNKPVNFEYQHENKYFSVTVSYIGKSELGRSRFSYIVQDVTDTRIAQNELRKVNSELEDRIVKRTEELLIQKRKLDSLLNALPVGVAFLDRDLRYEIINPVLADMNGKLPEEHLNKTLGEILPGYADLLGNNLKEVFKTGSPIENWEFEAYTPKDPTRKHTFLANYFPVDIEGRIVGVGGAIVDITKQVDDRKAILESEERFRQLANSLPQIIWTATPETFHVDWYNDWWYNYLGMPRGTRWDDETILPMHPEDLRMTKSILMEIARKGEGFEMEQRFRRGTDGMYRWHIVRGQPIKNEKGEIIKWVGANTDIHDHKLMLDELQREKRLREQFVATLTHDLRSPLAAAKMGAQLISRKPENIETVCRMSGRIMNSIDRIDTMIRDLLDTNRIKAGEKLPIEFGHCDLNKLVSDTIEELCAIHGDRYKIQLNKGVYEGQWSCSGIRRILENLCNNAIKYGSDKEPITISLSTDDTDIFLKVHNMGNPIPASEQAFLFDPYKRTIKADLSSHKGWGLGLTLVRGIAEAHGGSASVESSLVKGTTFTVKLPIKRPKPA